MKFNYLRMNGISGQVNNHEIKEDILTYKKLNYNRKLKDIDKEFSNPKLPDYVHVNTYNFFIQCTNDNTPLNFTYTWENLDMKVRFLKTLSEIASRTDVLVVIGYSFPFVNRNIDKEFFKT